MSSDSDDFSKYKRASQPSQTDEFSKYKRSVESQEKPKNDIGEKSKRDILRTLKVVGTSLGGQAGDVQQGLAGLIETGTEKLFGQKLPENFRKFIPGLNIPTAQEQRKLLEDVSGGYLAPVTSGEEKYEKGLDIATRLASGGRGIVEAPLSTLLKSITGGALGVGASDVAKQFGAGETGQGIAEATASILPFLFGGGNLPAKELKGVYDFAKSRGFTDKELTPLLQSKRKLKFLGPTAKKGEKINERFSDIQNRIKGTYDSLRQEGKNTGMLSQSQINDFGKELLNEFVGMPSSIRQHIQEDLVDLFRKPINGESLINLWQDINAIPSHLGRDRIADRFKPLIKNALEQLDPQLANDFSLTNQFFQKFKASSKALSPGQIDNWINLGEAGTLATGIVTGNLGLIQKVLGLTGARILARELLINPKLQNLNKKLINAMRQGKSEEVSKITDMIKNQSSENKTE